MQAALDALTSRVDTGFRQIEQRVAGKPEAAAEPEPPAAAKRVDLSAFTPEARQADVAKLRESDPESAADMEKALERRDAAIIALQEQQDSQRVANEKRAADDTLAARVAQVEEKHPGWEQTVDTDEFKEWLGKQPSYLRHAGQHSNDPADIIGIMDKYVADTKPPEQNAATEAEQAAAAKKKADEEAAAKAKADEEEAARKAALDPDTRPTPERQEPATVVAGQEAYFNGFMAADKDFKKQQEQRVGA